MILKRTCTNLSFIMKKLFQILTLAFILATASFSAKAQTPNPDYKALVSELLDLTKVRQMTEETLTATYNNMGLKFTIPTSQVVNEMFGSIWDKWIDDYTVIYSKYYTIDELKQLCDFYKTPLGEKVTKSTPELNRDALPMMQKYQSDFTTILTKYIKQ